LGRAGPRLARRECKFSVRPSAFRDYGGKGRVSQVTMNKIMNPRYLVAALTLIIAILSCAGHVVAQSQSDYVAIKVENAGTVTGVVKWAAPVPKIPKLSITKNADVCDPNAQKTRDLERLLIRFGWRRCEYGGVSEEYQPGQGDGSSRITPTHGSKELPIRPAHYAGATRQRSANQVRRSGKSPFLARLLLLHR
jgi:hypothetical protein